MLHRLLHMISTADLIKNNPDDWRDKLNERSKSKGKVVLVLFAVILVLCLFVRIITSIDERG